MKVAARLPLACELSNPPTLCFTHVLESGDSLQGAALMLLGVCQQAGMPKWLYDAPGPQGGDLFFFCPYVVLLFGGEGTVPLLPTVFSARHGRTGTAFP